MQAAGLHIAPGAVPSVISVSQQTLATHGRVGRNLWMERQRIGGVPVR
jgi:hypothetical protein